MSQRVLCIAPHCDDETLGCGGTLAKHARAGDEVHVAVVTGHGKDKHPLWGPEVWERVRAECKSAVDVLGVKSDRLHYAELPAAMMSSVPTHEKNRTVHELIARVSPNVLYVPFAFDIHLDHREIFHAASVAWRPHTELGRGIREIYAYETQSETHWNAGGSIEPGFVPNVWVDITDTLAMKTKALAKYESQMRPFPDARSIEAVEHLAKWRGSQMNVHAAEAFVLVRKLA